MFKVKRSLSAAGKRRKADEKYRVGTQRVRPGRVMERDFARKKQLPDLAWGIGFTYARDCSDCAPQQACKHFSPHAFYRSCHDQPIGESDLKAFREVITVFVQP